RRADPPRGAHARPGAALRDARGGRVARARGGAVPAHLPLLDDRAREAVGARHPPDRARRAPAHVRVDRPRLAAARAARAGGPGAWPPYVPRRVLSRVPPLFVIAPLTFALMRLAPGGPFLAEKDIPAAAKAELRHRYGLDRPLLGQYAAFLGNL